VAVVDLHGFGRYCRRGGETGEEEAIGRGISGRCSQGSEDILASCAYWVAQQRTTGNQERWQIPGSAGGGR
jgi:hypothetical protein